MEHDDDLIRFEAEGAAPLPATSDQGHVEHDGARIWYATCGVGRPVVLLHGVSHFAPLQRPALFNDAVLTFLAKL